MNINLRVLKVQHYGETPADDLWITLAGPIIKMLTVRDGMVQNRPIKETTIFFHNDPEPVELNLNEIDLAQVEHVVGAYGMAEEY